MDPFDRYQDIIPAFESFLSACARPLPRTVRRNSLRTTQSAFETALEEDGIEYEPIDWLPTLYEIDTDEPGNTWPYVHGWMYAQEVVSSLPSMVLDPERGETIFDACAAPGSKTTHLAELMDDTGTILANDVSMGRLSAFRSNTDRLGITNCVLTNQDGQHYSLKPLPIDAVDGALVDVPCTAEGTVRKNPDVPDPSAERQRPSMTGTQRNLLERAIELTRVGRTVVYSTCTFAPEENEAIVSSVLESHPCSLRVIDIPLETHEGLPEWDGEIYGEQLRKCRRIYPHENDTGGFFLAKLEVTA